jgi:uncharacterized protein YuzE
MYIGQICGKETIALEYKEFCLKLFPENLFSLDEIHDIIVGNWNPKLNPLVLKNLSLYFKTYVPECVSSFINAGIDGEIFIGCNDNGEISGIPFLAKTKVQIERFKAEIKNKIFIVLKKKIMNFDHKNGKKILPLRGIRLEITELISDERFVDDEARLHLQNYYFKSDLYQKAHELYKFEKCRWMKDVLKYSAKLEIILNIPEIRYEMSEYIKNKKHLYKNDENVVSNVLDLLASDRYILPCIGYEIQRARDDKKVETLGFWISIFKDERLEEIMKQKPERPLVQIPMSPTTMVRRLTLLKKRFIQREKNVHFFVIKIYVDGSKVKKDVKFTKYLNDKNKWVTKTRVLEHNGPSNIYKKI